MYNESKLLEPGSVLKYKMFAVVIMLCALARGYYLFRFWTGCSMKEMRFFLFHAQIDSFPIQNQTIVF